jgi:hypothetical protein
MRRSVFPSTRTLEAQRTRARVLLPAWFSCHFLEVVLTPNEQNKTRKRTTKNYHTASMHIIA